MKSEKLTYGEVELEIFSFPNPMSHEDWHKAEEMGLVFLAYFHHGPDYWNDDLAFVKKERKEAAEKWSDSQR